MSLINRMLQDRDARSTGDAATSAIHGQVRAVPERRKVHFAWWLALVLAGLLIAVLSLWFIYWAKPAIVPAMLAPPSPDLAMVPLPARPKPVAHPAPTADAPAPVAVMESEIKPAVIGQLKEVAPVTTAAVPAKPSVPLKEGSPPQIISAPVASVKAALQAVPKLAEPAPVAISKQVKELSPQQRAENEYRRATSLLQQGRVMETIEVLEQVLLLDPQHAAARQTLVGLLLESKRQDDAMRKMREGLNLDPNHPGLAMILARQQIEKGELKAAVETLQKTLPHALDRADYLAFLAALLQRQSNHKEAVEHYLSALRKMPQNGIWWMGLGISLQAENRLPEAQNAFVRAKESASLSPELLAFVEQKLTQLQR